MTKARHRRVQRWLVAPAIASALVAVGAPLAAAAQREPLAEQPFAVVLDDVIDGDLVMAGNSNVLSAGGWGRTTVADVDGDRSRICVGRHLGLAACQDNSSAATLDVPAGARVVAARLYVDTTLAPSVGPVRVRLDGPGEEIARELGATTEGVPKLYEAAGTARTGASARQAVWDVTDFVRQNGSGVYTVADIAFERAGPWQPYASWAIVAAYELDPALDPAIVAAFTPEQRQRFATRAVTWHDGFVFQSAGRLEIPVQLPPAPSRPGFAKSFHLIAHAQQGLADNVLFAGGPLGNNVTPGDSAPPPGVVVGTDAACNSTTDVLNDSICALGTAVTTKDPGPSAYLSSADGATPTSGSAVDIDIVRIPDRYLRAAPATTSLAVQTVADTTLAIGMLAVSIDTVQP
jgi:hypothetical protein